MDMPLTNVLGIGPARLKALKDAGLDGVRDLVLFLPREYRDMTRTERLSDAPPHDLQVALHQFVHPPRRAFVARNFRIRVVPNAGQMIGHRLERLGARHVEVDAEVADGGALLVPDEDRRRADSSSVARPRQRVSDVFAPRHLRTREKKTRIVRNRPPDGAPSHVSVFDRDDRVFRAGRIVEDDFVVRSEGLRQPPDFRNVRRENRMKRHGDLPFGHQFIVIISLFCDIL